MRERMCLLIADGGERGHDHVEAVEPRPALDEVETSGSQRHDENQSERNTPKIAKNLHLVVGRWSLVVSRCSDLTIACDQHATMDGSAGRRRLRTREQSL